MAKSKVSKKRTHIDYNKLFYDFESYESLWLYWFDDDHYYETIVSSMRELQETYNKSLSLAEFNCDYRINWRYEPLAITRFVEFCYLSAEEYLDQYVYGIKAPIEIDANGNIIPPQVIELKGLTNSVAWGIPNNFFKDFSHLIAESTMDIYLIQPFDLFLNRCFRVHLFIASIRLKHINQFFKTVYNYMGMVLLANWTVEVHKIKTRRAQEQAKKRINPKKKIYFSKNFHRNKE